MVRRTQARFQPPGRITPIAVVPAAAGPGWTRAWRDEFGSALITRDGEPGGLTVLVVTPLGDASNVLQVVQELSFNGRVHIAAPSAYHAAPLAAIFRALAPGRANEALVISLQSNGSLTGAHGPAVNAPHEYQEAPTGLGYREGGPDAYPAWDGGPLGRRLAPDAPGVADRACSIAAQDGWACLSAPTAELAAVLRAAFCASADQPASSNDFPTSR